MKALGSLLLVLLCLFASRAAADVFRPAYLQLRQTDPTHFDVLWKLPALDETTTLRLQPVFPPDTVVVAPRVSTYASGMAVQRWGIAIPGGLDGKAIAFPSLSTVRVDVLVRLERIDGSVQLERVLAANPRFAVTATPRAFDVVRTYTLLGVEHILTGFDHLLFVLALILLVRDLKRLMATVTAFTLAHSITLALATLGVIHVPGPPVEATIALSIVFVASEIVQQQRGRQGLAARKPWLVAFSFGLLHGLGFAGALAQVGLPHNSIPLALLFFNVGVEIGQLIFIAAVLLAARLAQHLAARLFAWPAAPVLPAYLIGALASYWVIQRISVFWS